MPFAADCFCYLRTSAADERGGSPHPPYTAFRGLSISREWTSAPVQVQEPCVDARLWEGAQCLSRATDHAAAADSNMFLLGRVSGCTIFENCKTCRNGSWGGTLDDFYVKGIYCAECRAGWYGGDCMRE